MAGAQAGYGVGSGALCEGIAIAMSGLRRGEDRLRLGRGSHHYTGGYGLCFCGVGWVSLRSAALSCGWVVSSAAGSRYCERAQARKLQVYGRVQKWRKQKRARVRG